MAEGLQNPFTEILEESMKSIRLLEAAIVEEYGTPLFTTEKKGAAMFEWPDDPDEMSPEEMQVLISTHGEEAVTAWITEFYITKEQAARVAAEQEQDF